MDQVIVIAFGLVLAIIDYIRSHPTFAAIVVAVFIIARIERDEREGLLEEIRAQLRETENDLEKYIDAAIRDVEGSIVNSLRR